MSERWRIQLVDWSKIEKSKWWYGLNRLVTLRMCHVPALSCVKEEVDKRSTSIKTLAEVYLRT